MSTLDGDVSYGSSVQYIEDLTGTPINNSLSAATVFAAAIIFHWINSSINDIVQPPDKTLKIQCNWRNIATSFVHASVVGSWSVVCLYKYPDITEDLITRHNLLGELLVAVSVGYFLYDLHDMLNFKKIKDAWPLMLHHITIVVCFGIALTTKQYIYYAVVSLLGEVNSIFLHGRQLLQMIGTPRNGMLYTVNSLLNIMTFIVFRFGVLLWMAWWIAANCTLVPLFLVGVASLGLTIMMCVNVVLFSRLIRSDFMRRLDNNNKKTVLDK
ncbi:TLC domain-containing protein 2-like [Ptychodera flava]|uniref:TLC domain-containing protein 2-like n=1 Tax=Ptychodera flava TaxID=63121 RepID=UPI003969D769